MARAKKGAQSSKQESERIAFGGGLTLGDDAVASIFAERDNRLRADNDKGANVFVLLSPAINTIFEHWVTQPGDEKKFYSSCGVQQLLSGKSADEQAEIISEARRGTVFTAHYCEICAAKEALDIQAQEAGAKTPVGKALRDIAYRHLGYSASVLMLAIKGEAVKTKVGGKVSMLPEFEKKDLKVPRVLSLTQAQFTFWLGQWNENGFKGSEARGLPFNLVRGANSEKEVSKTASVEFYPNRRIDDKMLAKVPQDPSELDWSRFIRIGQYDAERAREAVAEFQKKVLPGLISGKPGSTGKKTAKKTRR